MKNRILLVAISCALVLSLTAGCAVGADFDANSSPYQNGRTMTSTDIDVYTFSVGSGEKAEWKAVVTSGVNCDFFIMTADQVDKAKAGQSFNVYGGQRSKESKSASGTVSSSGDYALLITTSGTSGNATYTVDITKKAQSAAEVATNTLLYVLIVVVIVLVVIVWIFRAIRVAKALKGQPEQPPQQPPGAAPPGQAPPASPPQPPAPPPAPPQ